MSGPTITSVLFLSLTLAFAVGCASTGPGLAHAAPADEAQPLFEMQDLFEDVRIPNITVATDGTVLAFAKTGHLLRRSTDAGKTWTEVQPIAPKGGGGSAIVDENTGDILQIVPNKGLLYRSADSGKTWAREDIVMKPNAAGHGTPDGVPALTACSESGLTLRYGDHKGRLLMPARVMAPKGNNDQEWWPYHYNTAIYSDDGGKTWQTSGPFPAKGTGEGAVAELSDGRIYYNSRRHLDPEGVDPRKRWTAWSYDGGETWKDLAISKVLPDGAGGGCMGGLVRLPIRGKDILIFSNLPGASRPRRDGTAWASFDGGKTWPLKRLVYKGNFAYSSLNAGRPKTKSEGWIYLNFEGGPEGGSTVARFNLSWLLKGEKTGDGELPKWLARYQAPRKKEPAKNK